MKYPHIPMSYIRMILVIFEQGLRCKLSAFPEVMQLSEDGAGD